jgi:hypothetical protein
MRVLYEKGVSIVEVIVGLTIISFALIGLSAAYELYVRAALRNTSAIKAIHLTEEGVEALRLLRDGGYAATLGTLAPVITHYFSFSTTTAVWTATTTPEIVDGSFTRSFVVTNVYRNVSDDIASSGTLDPDTKKVAVTVAWGSGTSAESRTLTTYLTNLFDN